MFLIGHVVWMFLIVHVISIRKVLRANQNVSGKLGMKLAMGSIFFPLIVAPFKMWFSERGNSTHLHMYPTYVQ